LEKKGVKNGNVHYIVKKEGSSRQKIELDETDEVEKW